MGNLQPLVGGLKTHDIAADPAKALVDPMFLPAVGHKLHADANAEERPAIADPGLPKRVFYARKRAPPTRPSAARPHPGTHADVWGSPTFRFPVRHPRYGPGPPATGRRAGHTAQSAG